MQTFVTVREEEVVKQSECKLTFLQKKGEVVTEGECVWCVFHSYFVGRLGLFLRSKKISELRLLNIRKLMTPEPTPSVDYDRVM